jgi:hypothetical protein
MRVAKQPVQFVDGLTHSGIVLENFLKKTLSGTGPETPEILVFAAEVASVDATPAGIHI